MSAEDNSNAGSGANEMRPLNIINNSIGKKILAIARNDMEYRGILRGTDDFVNLVMEDVDIISHDEKGNTVTEHLHEVLVPGLFIVMLVALNENAPVGPVAA